jgi:hypothetical protein
MSGIDKVATAVKDKAHSFQYIRKATGLPLSDEQFLALIKENGDRFQFTRILRKDTAGNRVQPGWPGVKLRAAATT